MSSIGLFWIALDYILQVDVWQGADLSCHQVEGSVEPPAGAHCELPAGQVNTPHPAPASLLLHSFKGTTHEKGLMLSM